jgi:DNA-binding transcriptional ArsR family regulator
VARASTTTDVYSAIAEPRRRQIIDLLARHPDSSVSQIVAALQLPQPAVSKHLGVLRKVGVVTVTKRGQQRLYHLNAQEIKVVHDWAKTFERFWSHQVDRIKHRAVKKDERMVKINLEQGTPFDANWDGRRRVQDHR